LSRGFLICESSNSQLGWRCKDFSAGVSKLQIGNAGSQIREGVVIVIAMCAPLTLRARRGKATASRHAASMLSLGMVA
jgi:hypothetical protein